MTPVETIALVLAAVTLIKLLVLMYDPKQWLGVAEAVYSGGMLLSVASLVLAYFVYQWLLVEMTLVQIWAAWGLMMLLMIPGITPYGAELSTFVKKVLKKGCLQKAWLSCLVWLVLSVMVLKELLM